jgi:hypothetical protein
MLHTMKSSPKRRFVFATAVTVCLLALLGSACQPVRSFWEAPQNPTGHLDLVEGGNGEVRVAGWATQIPPVGTDDVLRPQKTTQIVVLVGGQWAQGAVSANLPRPDVEAAIGTNKWFGAYTQPNMGYGFDFTKPAPKGEVVVCVAALNPFMGEEPVPADWGLDWGPRDHVLLGCRTVTVT